MGETYFASLYETGSLSIKALLEYPPRLTVTYDYEKPNIPKP